MRILQISTRPFEFWSTMCNEGELLEKFNIQLSPIPMPELTDEVKKAKEEGTEVAEVMDYCRKNMEVQVKDNELENVAALKVAMKRLVKKYGSDRIFFFFPEMSLEQAEKLIAYADANWSDVKGTFEEEVEKNRK